MPFRHHPLTLAALTALVMVAALTRCESQPEPPLTAGGADDYVRFVEPIMATSVEVLVPVAAGADAAEAVFAVFRDVDSRMSEWKESSPLSTVNRAAGAAPRPVPEDLRAVVRRGIEIGVLTGGAFDVTWAALWGVWDFKATPPGVPDAALIESRLELVDYTRVEIDDEAGTIYLPHAGMVLGLGGIAKGYALDRAAEALRERDVESFLLSAGGQMMAGGKRGARPWRVGIRDPRSAPADYFARLEVGDASVSTSGDYEQFFVIDGVRYHHILDPRTGRPTTGMRSVTVVSGDATLADALSTALMIMDAERGLSLVESLDDVDAVLVDAANTVHVSSGLQGRLDLVHPPTP